MRQISVLAFVISTLVQACAAYITPATVIVPPPSLSTAATLLLPMVTQTRKPKIIAPITPVATVTLTLTPVAPHTPTPDPSDWKEWPVIPTIDPSIHAIYEYGQSLGNDPHALSIFGDCQARPGEFFGMFET